MTETLSGSITLKRLKKGVNVILYISTSNAAMYQGWNKATAAVSPDFTQAENQPVLTPTAVAGSGQTASITQGTWYYNGTALTFSGTADSSGFIPGSSDSRFKYNPNTKALRIVGNIASATNTSNDVLKFSGGGECAGVDWTGDASAELHLQEIGSSSAQLLLTADRATLDSTNTTATATATLMISGEEMTSGYTYKWTDESGATIQTSTSRTCTVKRDHITAIGGIWCFAYLSTDTTTAIASAFIEFIDLADQYELEASVSSDWDGSTAQTVTAKLYKYSSSTGKGEKVSLDGYTVTHRFVGASTDTEYGTLTGAEVSVDSGIWGKADDNEDIIDFIAVSK